MNSVENLIVYFDAYRVYIRSFIMTMTSLESYLHSIWEQILNNIISTGKYDKVVYDAYIQKTKLNSFHSYYIRKARWV